MPFPMKIQPIDIDTRTAREQIRTDSAKPVFKSRLRRLFDRPFPSVLRISAVEKPIVGEPAQFSSKDGGGGVGTEFEPTSVCLDKMVQNFIEDSNEKQPAAVKYGRNRCNCFNANSNDSSDDEFDVFGGFGESITSGSSGGDACDMLKVNASTFFIPKSPFPFLLMRRIPLTEIPNFGIRAFPQFI